MLRFSDFQSSDLFIIYKNELIDLNIDVVDINIIFGVYEYSTISIRIGCSSF